MRLDPKDYNLPSRTQLAKLAENSIALVVDRKSRILMADGVKLLKKIATIKEKDPSIEVCIMTTAPVCSKTRLFLENSNVELRELTD